MDVWYMNCKRDFSCDDENIKKELEEKKKNMKFCYIKGPTGPRETRRYWTTGTSGNYKNSSICDQIFNNYPRIKT